MNIIVAIYGGKKWKLVYGFRLLIRKLEKAKIFQLCTVIFPTMIMEVQIIKIFPLYAQSVKISAFHLQRFGNGEILYERSEKNVKI